MAIKPGLFDNIKLSPSILRLMLAGKTQMAANLRAMLVEGEIDVGTTVAELLDKLDAELEELREKARNER